VTFLALGLIRIRVSERWRSIVGQRENFLLPTTEDSSMNKYLPIALLGIVLALSAGCSHRLAQELDARLESAENNAASARLRADEAYIKADKAEAIANQTQRTAEEATIRIGGMNEKMPRK
jgi:hypothetical protein